MGGCHLYLSNSYQMFGKYKIKRENTEWLYWFMDLSEGRQLIKYTEYIYSMF